MKYTVTTSEVKEAKVSPQLSLALAIFKKLQRAEKRVDKLEVELEGWLSEVPIEEMQVYVDITSEWLKE